MTKAIKIFLFIRKFIHRLPEYIIWLSGKAISILTFFMIFALIAYAGTKAISIYKGFANYTPGNVLYDVAILMVIIKVYMVLLYYYRRHRISLKYIVEISIIVPAINIVFATGAQALWITVLLGVFSVANLFIYIYFYDKLSEVDERESNCDAELCSAKKYQE